MKIRQIVTDYKKGYFLKELEEQEMTKGGEGHLINIYPEVTYQAILGFGGAFTEASAYNVAGLSEANRDEIVKAYFGEEGIGYTLCRTHINSCDFSLGNYAYVEDEKDTTLSTFNRSRDRENIVPFIKAAQKESKRPISFLASPWSPPAFMKDNQEMNNGGRLKPEYKKMWAQYIAKYIKDCKEDGITISRITVQNEPEATQTWDSCRYSVEEEMQFVRDELGPTLKEEGLGDVKILVWDHNKELLYERAKGILEDPIAASYVGGLAFHWYTGDHFDAISLVREKYPEQELIFTEGCVEYSRFADSSEVYKAEMYGHDMIGDLNAGAHGFIDWNMVLDEKGGPNHVGNLCAAPIMCNREEDTFEKRLSYYYIGHFSKYILPGAKRIATTKFSDVIEVTAFLNPDGERVVVLLNKGEDNLELALREYNEGSVVRINAHSIVTLCYR